MTNEFVAKNGLISQNNTTVSGSLTVTGATTLQGTQTITGSSIQLVLKTSATAPLSVQTTNYNAGTTGTSLFFGLGTTTGNTYGLISSRINGGTGAGNLFLQSAGGNVGIAKTVANAVLDVNGNTTVSGSLIVNTTSGIPVQIKGGEGTLLSISGSTNEIFRISDTYSPNLFTVSTGSTTVFNIDNSSNALISGTLAVGTSSLGPNENTLTLGARDAANEGGQLGFNAPGGTYASASFLDLYQNRFRLLRGTNAGSTGEVATWNLGTLQMQLPAYTSPTSYPGTVAALLGVDSGGNVVTVPGWVDYSGTSTIQGFSSYVAGGKNIQYQIEGKTMYVQFDLRSATNAGSGSVTNFTIPNNTSAWAGTQVGMCRTQNTTTQNVGMYQIVAGSNQVNFYTTSNNVTLNSWTDAGTRHIQGFAVINIA